jgi:hypothetical protein
MYYFLVWFIQCVHSVVAMARLLCILTCFQVHYISLFWCCYIAFWRGYTVVWHGYTGLTWVQSFFILYNIKLKSRKLIVDCYKSDLPWKEALLEIKQNNISSVQLPNFEIKTFVFPLSELQKPHLNHFWGSFKNMNRCCQYILSFRNGWNKMKIK